MFTEIQAGLIPFVNSVRLRICFTLSLMGRCCAESPKMEMVLVCYLSQYSKFINIRTGFKTNHVRMHVL